MKLSIRFLVPSRSVRYNERRVSSWEIMNEWFAGNTDWCLLIPIQSGGFFFVTSWWSVFTGGKNKLLQGTSGILWPENSEKAVLPPKTVLDKVCRDRGSGAFYLFTKSIQPWEAQQKEVIAFILYMKPTFFGMWICSQHISESTSSSLTLTCLYTVGVFIEAK